LLQNGDEIEWDVAARRLHMRISGDELEARRVRRVAPADAATRGHLRL
jgi:dihydroxyacid dehydratase/phosphogluconate dehydratase